MTPRVSPAHLEARRTEILEAAWRCFGRKGFHDTTMRDICAEADLSAGAVYQYFEGKDALIRAVAEEGRRAGAAKMVGPDEADTALDAAARSLGRFLGCLADPDVLPAIRIDVRLQAEALRETAVRDVVLENHRHLLDRFQVLVRQAQEEGAVASGLSARGVARVLVAVYLGLELQKATEPDLDLEPSMQAVDALVRGAFKGGEG